MHTLFEWKTGVSVAICIVLFAISCGPATHREDHTHVDTTGIETTGEHEPFATIAESYESVERVIWQKPELIIDRMGDLEGKTVADIGAGTGYFAFRIADRGANVIAIDIDPRAIRWMEQEELSYSEALQERFKTRLAQEDDPRLSPGEADIVLMVNTYIYISDRIAYFQGLKRGIIPGGELYIIDFKKTETDIGPALEERLAVSTVTEELAKAGYEIVNTDTTTLTYQYIITAAPRFEF